MGIPACWKNESISAIVDRPVSFPSLKVEKTASVNVIRFPVGITDFRAAMAITKELMKYVLDQPYCIPTPAYPNYVLWWPWLKNYSGELSVGYAPGDSWVQYVWIDQDLKKEMGY